MRYALALVFCGTVQLVTEVTELCAVVGARVQAILE